MTSLSGCLFDKDGTLFDFQRTWGVWACGLMARLGQGDALLTARLADRAGLDLARQVFLPHSPVIAGTNGEVVDLLATELPDMPRRDLLAMLNRAGQEAVPVQVAPLGPTLQQLRALGQTLGVVTNDAENSARAQLEQAGVTAQFDFIAGFDSGFGAKPDAGPCLAFCKATGLAPAQVVMVGDSTHDMQAGRAAGMRFVAVLTGVATAQDLAPHADAVLPDIGHLATWLEQQTT